MSKLALAIAGFGLSISAAQAQQVTTAPTTTANYQLPREDNTQRPAVLPTLDTRITAATTTRDDDSRRYRLTVSPLSNVFEPQAAAPEGDAWRNGDIFNDRGRGGPRRVALGLGGRWQLDENMQVTGGRGGVVSGSSVVVDTQDGPQLPQSRRAPQ